MLMSVIERNVVYICCTTHVPCRRNFHDGNHPFSPCASTSESLIEGTRGVCASRDRIESPDLARSTAPTCVPFSGWVVE